MSTPPLPPASTLRRPPRFPTAVAAILAGFLGIQVLNFTGFCYRDARYFSSIEFGDPGTAVYAADRDTHFAFLGDVRVLAAFPT